MTIATTLMFMIGNIIMCIHCIVLMLVIFIIVCYCVVGNLCFYIKLVFSGLKFSRLSFCHWINYKRIIKHVKTIPFQKIIFVVEKIDDVYLLIRFGFKVI